jgi:DNA-binding NarL/FixJ family response regulator
MINVLLAENHLILRDGIKALLKDHPDIKIIAEASNGTEVQKMLVDSEVDLLILDINMPEMDGLKTAEYVKDNHKNIKVLVLSMLDQEKFVSKSLAAGALGYILKTTGKDELVNAIKMVAKGDPYISHKISASMIKNLNYTFHSDKKIEVDLSPRELEILHLIADGLTNAEIADKIFTSKRTVESHRKNLIDKTGTKNTAALIKFALVNGILK